MRAPPFRPVARLGPAQLPPSRRRVRAGLRRAAASRRSVGADTPCAVRARPTAAQGTSGVRAGTHRAKARQVRAGAVTMRSSPAGLAPAKAVLVRCRVDCMGARSTGELARSRDRGDSRRCQASSRSDRASRQQRCRGRSGSTADDEPPSAPRDHAAVMVRRKRREMGRVPEWWDFGTGLEVEWGPPMRPGQQGPLSQAAVDLQAAFHPGAVVVVSPSLPAHARSIRPCIALEVRRHAPGVCQKRPARLA